MWKRKCMHCYPVSLLSCLLHACNHIHCSCCYEEITLRKLLFFSERYILHRFHVDCFVFFSIWHIHSVQFSQRPFSSFTMEKSRGVWFKSKIFLKTSILLTTISVQKVSHGDPWKFLAYKLLIWKKLRCFVHLFSKTDEIDSSIKFFV